MKLELQVMAERCEQMAGKHRGGSMACFLSLMYLKSAAEHALFTVEQRIAEIAERWR